jgi:hypothetical protein
MKAGTMVGAALACALAVVALAALPAAAHQSAAVSSKSCELTDAEINGGLGARYVYSIDVRNIDCDKAKRLVKKFHKCRHENGGRDGHCSSFKGYQCKQKKLDSSPQLQQWKATCKSGSKKFKQTFGESP